MFPDSDKINARTLRSIERRSDPEEKLFLRLRNRRKTRKRRRNAFTIDRLENASAAAYF